MNESQESRSTSLIFRFSLLPHQMDPPQPGDDSAGCPLGTRGHSLPSSSSNAALAPGAIGAVPSNRVGKRWRAASERAS